MKIQYFGDVNDYRKYALLRLLAKEGGFKIGVCWMLTEDDGGPHGKNRGYRDEPSKWNGFDPELFDLLTAVPDQPGEADLQRVERQGLIPEAIYFEGFNARCNHRAEQVSSRLPDEARRGRPSIFRSG